MTASWYLQGAVYVGMSALRGIRVQCDGADWWAIDRRDPERKPRGFGPYRGWSVADIEAWSLRPRRQKPRVIVHSGDAA